MAVVYQGACASERLTGFSCSGRDLKLFVKHQDCRRHACQALPSKG